MDRTVTLPDRVLETVRETLVLATGGEREEDETPAQQETRIGRLMEAIAEIDRVESDALIHAGQIHERHVNLTAGCPLCEQEAGHQRDRLLCDLCGEPLRPDEPYDGHYDCEVQR